MKSASPRAGSRAATARAAARQANSSGLVSLWNGVRMRRQRAAADPDAATRLVTLPADWEDEAASGLAALASGQGAVTLAAAVAAWLGRLPAGSDLPPRLVGLLLRRAACPTRAVWQPELAEAPGFVVNLAAFAEGGLAFDTEGFTDALATLGGALDLLGGGRTGRLLLSNLDPCLAALGLDYDSDAGRDTAACLAALTTGTLGGRPAGASRAGVMVPRSPVPGLGARAAAAWGSPHRAARSPGPALPCAIETGFSTPGPADALLGVEACGLAPLFSPLRADGRLSASTLARLAARGLSPEAALAATLAGETLLRPADFSSLQAMGRATAPFVDRAAGVVTGAIAGAMEPAASGSGVPRRRELPSRHGGFTQKAAIGGHRLYLRTGEYEDGALGEVSISLVRESANGRAMMEAFCHSVSLGLQHGVPLDAYVEAFAYTRFGPGGPVEGDASVGRASSVLDYAFRSLAQAYLGRQLDDAAPEEDAEAPLPLDLPAPREPSAATPGSRPGLRRHHALRLVG